MIQKVAKSFGSLTTIRIISRTYLIRTLLSKQILGHMVHLDLIITSSLHILKSCLKPSYQKVLNIKQQKNNIISSMNLMNLGIIISTICAIIVCGIQLYQYENQYQEKRLVNFNYCIIMYGLAVVFQAMYEKFNVINVLKYNYTKSALIQMASFLPKSLFIFVAAQIGLFEKYGILVFGIGHIIYTFLLMTISFITAPNQYKTFFNIKIHKQQKQVQNQKQVQKQVQQQPKSTQQISPLQQYYFIDPLTKQSAKQFSSFSFLKLLLQQFQKILLISFNISSFSSTYTLISNLGSIVVRYLFAPLQQIVYNYFSRGQQKQSINTLIILIKSLLVFSLLCLTFGYNYSQSLLSLLYGQKWISLDSILAMQIYTLLLSIMGINGIIQAFLFAKGVQSFKKYKYISIAPTLIYILLSIYFISYTTFGTASFFLSNTISMIIRIIICWNLEVKIHVQLYQFMRKIIPSKFFIISVIVTFFLGSKQFGIKKYDSHFFNMIIGGMLFIGNLLVVGFENRHIIKQKVKEYLNKNKQKAQ